MRISSHKGKRKCDDTISKYFKKNVVCGAGIVLISASKYLSVSQVRKLSDYTSKYSASNNPEHIGSSNDEAFAESLYFYVINKDMIKEELPAIYDYWHIFNIE